MAIPPGIISLLQSPYSALWDFPLIEGHTYTSHLQTCGLRQRCPLIPLLFVLYLNVLFFALPHHAPPPPQGATFSSHALSDDLLFRSTSGQHIKDILRFFDDVGRKWGFDMNLRKAGFHPMGSALQCSFPTRAKERQKTGLDQSKRNKNSSGK